MAEDPGKEEQKFDFTGEGEAVGYISLAQARLQAMQTARETPGNYGPALQSVPMVFEVVDTEETEDDFILTLTFRPEGEFTGAPGREQFVFRDKIGQVAFRQVMSLPRRGRRFLFLPIAIGLVTVGVVVAISAAFAVGGFGDDEALVSVAAPTETPTPTDPPTPTSESTPISTISVPTTSTTTPPKPPAPSPTDTPNPEPTNTPTSAPTTAFVPSPTVEPPPLTFTNTIPVEQLIEEFQKDIVKSMDKYDGHVLTVSGRLNGAGTIPVGTRYLESAFVRVAHYERDIQRTDGSLWCMVEDSSLSGNELADLYGTGEWSTSATVKGVFTKSDIGYTSDGIQGPQIEGRVLDTRLVVLNPCSVMHGLDLKLKRVQAGLTLWQLGQLAGVHPALISEMERGQRPITDAVVAAFAGVSEDD